VENTHLKNSVLTHRAISRRGLSERLFAWMFKGLVYPQIWEDPELDLEALQLGPDDRMLAIASGGCNVLSYLVHDPAHLEVVDLNPSHVALTKLKLAAVRHLPNYDTLFRLFGRADEKQNLAAYDQFVRPYLDDTTRRYWDGRRLTGSRRVNIFTSNIYRHGLLGRFIGSVHILARLHGCDPRRLLRARTLEEQREVFDKVVAPLFDSRIVRWLSRMPASLYGLGIPPAQYEALAGDANGDMADLLHGRLRRLACDFPLENNYFAWQAFGRRYDLGGQRALPPYLRPENYTSIRQRVDRVSVSQTTLTNILDETASESFDCYSLLDSQDWMTDMQLTELWEAITRTAKPGARVIFRTAAEESLLPGRIPDALLDQWSYDREACRALTARDRSSIYGGFHLYVLKNKEETHVH